MRWALFCLHETHSERLRRALRNPLWVERRTSSRAEAIINAMVLGGFLTVWAFPAYSRASCNLQLSSGEMHDATGQP